MDDASAVGVRLRLCEGGTGRYCCHGNFQCAGHSVAAVRSVPLGRTLLGCYGALCSQVRPASAGHTLAGAVLFRETEQDHPHPLLRVEVQKLWAFEDALERVDREPSGLARIFRHLGNLE